MCKPNELRRIRSLASKSYTQWPAVIAQDNTYSEENPPRGSHVQCMQNWPAHSMIAYMLEHHGLTATGFNLDQKPFVVADIGTGNTGFLLGLTSRLRKEFGVEGLGNVKMHGSDITSCSRGIMKARIANGLLPKNTEFHKVDAREMEFPSKKIDFAALDYVLPYMTHEEGLTFVREKLTQGITENGAISIRLLTVKGDRYKYISKHWINKGNNQFEDPKTGSILSFYDDVQIQALEDAIDMRVVYWAEGIHQTNSYGIDCNLGTYSLIFSNNPVLEDLKPSVPPYAGYAMQLGMSPETAYIINHGKWDTRAALLRENFTGIRIRHLGLDESFLQNERKYAAAEMVVASLANYAVGPSFNGLMSLVEQDPDFLSRRIQNLTQAGSFVSWNCNFLENDNIGVPSALTLNPKVVGGEIILRARGQYHLGPNHYSLRRQVLKISQSRHYSTQAMDQATVSGCHTYPAIFSNQELKENWDLIQGYFKQKLDSLPTYNGYTKRSFYTVKIPSNGSVVTAKLFENYSDEASILGMGGTAKTACHDLLYFEKNECPAELRLFVDKVLAHPDLLKAHPEGVASFKLTVNNYGPDAEFRFHKDLVTNGEETWIVPLSNVGAVSEMEFIDAKDEKDGPLSDVTITHLKASKSSKTMTRNPGDVIRLTEENLRTFAHSVTGIDKAGGASLAIGITFNPTFTA